MSERHIEEQQEPMLRSSSTKWGEAEERKAIGDMLVSYGGGIVDIRKGDQYFVDSTGDILVGWHGTYDPPCGMDDSSLVD